MAKEIKAKAKKHIIVIIIDFHYSLLELLECIIESYTPKPHAELLKQVFDIRTWMADITIDLHNIINPHCFVLRKSSRGDVVLKYKNWTRDEEWKPSNNVDDGIVILSVNMK